MVSCLSQYLYQHFNYLSVKIIKGRTCQQYSRQYVNLSTSLPGIFTVEYTGEYELCKDTNNTTAVAVVTSDATHLSPCVSFCGVDIGILQLSLNSLRNKILVSRRCPGWRESIWFSSKCEQFHRHCVHSISLCLHYKHCSVALQERNHFYLILWIF